MSGTAVPRRRRWIAILAAAILVFSGVGYAAATAVASSIKRIPIIGLSSERPANQGGTNILLIGTDDRSELTIDERARLHVGQGEYGKNTDSMMIVSIANDGSVGVVSIPRDSYVDIPSHTGPKGITTPASKQKINAAYSLGGASLAVATVENNTGVPIDHVVEINFAGFVSMVDALGGVNVCLPQPIKDEKAGLDLPAGDQTLDGPLALGFVRARSFDPTADIGRMKRQQDFVAAVFRQVMSPLTLFNLPRMAAFSFAAAGSLTVDEGFSNREMFSVLTKMRSVTPSSMTFQTIPVGGESSTAAGDVVTWDEPRARALFAKLRDGQPIATVADLPTARVTTPPSDISVAVFNGSDVSSLGARAAADLTAAGFNVSGAPQNADDNIGDTTVIEYDPNYDVSLETLKAAFPDAEFVAVPDLGGTFRVIIGSNYDGLRTVAVKPATPADKPKTAADNPCA